VAHSIPTRYDWISCAVIVGAMRTNVRSTSLQPFIFIAFLAFHTPWFPGPVLADPIVTVIEKDGDTGSLDRRASDPRRTSWIAELERTRNRVKRKTGVDLDIELAKSLCRSGSIERCEETIQQLQSQVTTLLSSTAQPPAAPTAPGVPQSNSSIVILTQPRHRGRGSPTYPPPVFGTPKFPPPHQPRVLPDEDDRFGPIHHLPGELLPQD
jgi:hypothetical protein